MRRLLSFLFLGAGVTVIACASESNNDVDGIHPQPQPNRHPLAFTAPCTPEVCGAVPESIGEPRCKPLPEACAWSDDRDGTVSYRFCEDSECGAPPTADVCPAGTLFGSNNCGAENDDPCAWTTSCVAPRSTTPCPNPEGCGGQPMIGVICQDGTNGGLACMQVDAGCEWQRDCD